MTKSGENKMICGWGAGLLVYIIAAVIMPEKEPEVIAEDTHS